MTIHSPTNRHAFTLIELLIVVAIIAILAAIAVPNFLEAQVRSKVSRARADLRSIATGIEAYVVDHNHYPPNEAGYNVLPPQLSTPIAYLTNARLVDPFGEKEFVFRPNITPELAKFYSYLKVMTFEENQAWSAAGLPTLAAESFDFSPYNVGAAKRYGGWRMSSYGPDRVYSGYPDTPHPVGSYNLYPVVLYGTDIPYDSTNGTVSFGSILRTQALPDGAKLL